MTSVFTKIPLYHQIWWTHASTQHLPINMSHQRCISSLFSSFLPLLLLLQNSAAMLSAIPAIFSSEPPVLGNTCPAFETGYSPWPDCSELFWSFEPPLSPKPVVTTSSGSDEPDKTQTISNSGSDEPNQPVSIIDERKRRRMISNRESARRSRMRKQRHLENLRNQVNRLKNENRELTNRLRFVLCHCHHVRTDNDRLQSEFSMLRQKLLNIRQILQFRQLQQYTSAWPCNNLITSDMTPTSLIV